MEIPKTCWYCKGGGTMVEDSKGAKCSSCGATWSPSVSLGASCLETEYDPIHHYTKGKPVAAVKIKRGKK